MAAVHLLIKGKVQGVYYRATARDIARSLGVTGWIRNTPAGEVEAVVVGSEEQIEAFIAWSRNGPSGARVTAVQATPVAENSFPDFSIVRA